MTPKRKPPELDQPPEAGEGWIADPDDTADELYEPEDDLGEPTEADKSEDD